MNLKIKYRNSIIDTGLIGSKVNNASPMKFYGMHFEDGVAQYKDMEDEPMIYISSETAKQMDATFENKPVFVLHTDDEERLNDVTKADGIVVRSFYNKYDGKHWAEFIIWTEEAINAIKRGWKLSNGYIPSRQGNGGRWHGIDFDSEILSADYEHLAIVPVPRYGDSVVLTPDEFSTYNETKKAEIKKLRNSQGESKVKKVFNFFKTTRATVENQDQFLGLSVELPRTGKVVEIQTLLNEADKKPEEVMANGESMVEFENGERMKLKELMNKYTSMLKKKNEGEEDDKKENMSEEEKKKMKNSIDSDEQELLKLQEKIQKKKENYNKLNNAIDNGMDEDVHTIRITTVDEQFQKGKERY